jgi:anthranilate synthase/aminodeoxychorismate synthase-like glutamine amidotransferase
MILLIDNYDSFTYNIYQYLEEMGHRTKVFRNDKITIEKIKKLNPKVIILSPGPGQPKDAGICLEIIEQFKGKIPILGICLGHQAIGVAFGGKIVKAKRLMHGKISKIYHKQKGTLKKLPTPFNATRYHSLIVDQKTLPKCLEITAKTDDGIIMGLRHKIFPIEGLQFHPESIMTEKGHDMFNNFITNLGRKQ